MSIESKLQSDGSLLLLIAEDMTIYSAAEHKRNLHGLLLNNKCLRLDLSAVDEIDSAGLQLLIFLKREATRLDVELSLVSHSPAVLEVLELLNLGKQFGDPILLAAARK